MDSAVPGQRGGGDLVAAEPAGGCQSHHPGAKQLQRLRAGVDTQQR